MTVAASHMSFSCIDSETDAPMRSIVSCITIGCIYLCIYAYIHALSDEEEEEEEEEGLLFAK
jgi:hypothetical protein